MDADDISRPERLERQIAWAEKDDLDVCGAGFVDRFGTQAGLLWFAAAHADIERELLFRIGMLHPTLLYRAAVARDFPFQAAGADDYDQQIRLSAARRLGNLPAVLADHRCHASQVHLTQSALVASDMARGRHRHLARLFPEATPHDQAIVTRLAGKKGGTSLRELEEMGLWLLRLARSEDPLLRRRMLLRWWTACTRSTALGPGCFDLFRTFEPRFAAPPLPLKRHALRAACLLRLQYGGLLHAGLGRLRTGAARNLDPPAPPA